MEEFQRYAVYYTPPRGPFAAFAAEWLGWCAISGIPKYHPEVAGLPRPVAEITATPRKYGFHGTIKPPFRLANGTNRRALEQDMASLAARLAPVVMDGGLALRTIGGFLALVPEGDAAALGELAAQVVRGLDSYRAPPSAAEIAKRLASGLTARQEALLSDWGYPYVMEEFRFHLTLTGHLPEGEAAQVAAALDPLLVPLTPRPFAIRDLCLCGEDADGMFHLIQRYTLAG